MFISVHGKNFWTYQSKTYFCIQTNGFSLWENVEEITHQGKQI